MRRGVSRSVPRPAAAWNSGKSFFNIEGTNNGNFASFGVADFDGGSFDFGFAGPVTDVTSVTLTLTQSNANFTADGSLLFFLSGNTTRSIEPDTTGAPATGEIFFDANDTPDGIGTQLDPIFATGTGTFTRGADTTATPGGTGTVDTFTLTLSQEAESLLIGALNSDSRIRLVAAPGARESTRGGRTQRLKDPGPVGGRLVRQFPRSARPDIVCCPSGSVKPWAQAADGHQNHREPACHLQSSLWNAARSWTRRSSARRRS